MYEDIDALGDADGLYASHCGTVREDGPCSQFIAPIYTVYMEL
jgi:hypothetical protein